MSTTHLPSDLPSPRRFVAALISSLHEQDRITNSNLYNSKQTLLTLHVLFQNELLPALDLLDRGLVTRLRCSDKDPSNEVLNSNDPTAPRTVPETCAYYVRSGQAQASRHHSNSRFRNAAYDHVTYYEVHLEAWSCSCPAFAFLAFPATASEVREPMSQHQDESSTSPEWIFGGSMTIGADMPICKHLLACVLVEHSRIFSDMVEEREVSMEEMAGWAAGWGD